MYVLPSGREEGDSERQACAAGMYNGEAGGSCSPCVAGKFASSPRAVACRDCGIGTSSVVVGTAACTDCEIGKFADTPGSL